MAAHCKVPPVGEEASHGIREARDHLTGWDPLTQCVQHNQGVFYHTCTCSTCVIIELQRGSFNKKVALVLAHALHESPLAPLSSVNVSSLVVCLAFFPCPLPSDSLKQEAGTFREKRRTLPFQSNVFNEDKQLVLTPFQLGLVGYLS